jgi:hypothetical protein
MTAHQYIHSHPGIFIASLASLVTGYVVPDLADIYTWEIPKIALQILQAAAWVSTIVIGWLTFRKKK